MNRSRREKNVEIGVLITSHMNHNKVEKDSNLGTKNKNTLHCCELEKKKNVIKKMSCTKLS